MEDTKRIIEDILQETFNDTTTIGELAHARMVSNKVIPLVLSSLGIEEVVYNIMHDCESYIADSSNKEWFKERVSLNFHHQLQKALRCGKDMGDGSVCGCKLDCHLHDWRQRDELQKARQDWLREIEEVMRVDIGDASPTRLALRALLYRHQEELNKQ